MYLTGRCGTLFQALRCECAECRLAVLPQRIKPSQPFLQWAEYEFYLIETSPASFMEKRCAKPVDEVIK
jgi:hypothetical protein